MTSPPVPRPASAFDLATLAELFASAYEGYPLPVHMDEAILGMMVECYDESLADSVVLEVDGLPAALALLAVRPPHGWVGGMGVVAAHRRRGLGRVVMQALIERARARGLSELWLEVLEMNEAAHALYRSLGFRDVRAVDVWSLPAAEVATGLTLEAGAEPGGPLLEPEPWQRSAGTRARFALRPPGVEHLRLSLEGLEGAITWRGAGEARALLDARGGGDAAWWARALAQALLAHEARTLRLLNVASGGVLAEAARLAGGTRDTGQFEMCLTLTTD